jgi:hypothetical protein
MSNLPVTRNAIEEWRIAVLDAVTRVLFFLALPLLVVNSILAIHDDNMKALLMGIFSVTAWGVITFWRSLGMLFRGFTIIALSFVVGTYWLATTGLPGTGRLYFLFVVALASILLQKRIAIVIWIVSIVTVGLIYIAFAVELLPLPTTILGRLFDPATLAAGWIAQGLISIAIGTAIVMAVDTALKSNAKAETAARKLQRVNEELEKRVREQTDELRRQADFNDSKTYLETQPQNAWAAEDSTKSYRES